VNRVLTPKTLARAIGVSESSLKRWADEGVVQASRTLGGHRRIALAEAVRFVRSIGATVVRPDLLGLSDLAGVAADFAAQKDPRAELIKALEAGDAPRVRGMVQALYLSGWTVPQLCDGPLREAMVHIGKLWLHAEWGIVVEHRATDICVQAVNQLRMMLPSSTGSGPTVLGCALDEDPYLLPSLMAAATLAELGFSDVNLGPMTPGSVLQNAIRHYQPALVWVSVSTGRIGLDPVEQINQIARDSRAVGCKIVAGGRALEGVTGEQLPGVCIAQSMADLAEFARPLAPKLGAKSEKTPKNQHQ
jgi:methanogenic corrinoid protein MtbC1